MKRIATIIFMRRMAVMAIIAVLPAMLPAQTLKESTDKLKQSVEALKRVSGYPDQMLAWDYAKARYLDSIKERNNLQKEVEKKDGILKEQNKHYSKIEKLASCLRPDAERQAEAVLTRRYNADDVQQALQNLDPTTDVAKRLSQYQAMTIQLRNVLLDSDKDPSKRRTFASEESKKEYLEGVFNKIQKGLPSALYAPDAYPYLYEVLNEALDAKMEDTRFNFSDIINEKL